MFKKSYTYQPSLTMKLRVKWERSRVGRWWMRALSDYRYQKEKEKPAGFILRIAGKLVVLGAGATTLAVAVSPLLGEQMSDLYRGFTKNPDLSLSFNARADGWGGAKKDPLFIGTADIERTIVLQEDLVSLGYPIGECGANGILNEADMRAVNWFRRSVGVKESEFVDHKTFSMIRDQAERRGRVRALFGEGKEFAGDMLVFQPGIFPPNAAEKAIIREFQADLFQSGYKLSFCMFTGTMDKETVAAVEKFKTDNKIFPVTSAVDLDLRHTLRLAARTRAAENGTLETVKRQGTDYLSASIYGQKMNEDEMKILARKYVEKGVGEYIVSAVLDASIQTGMDFSYLMDIAAVESGFRPWVKADCPQDMVCTATGTFQFIDDTWKDVFKRYAERYGYQDLVNSLNRNDPHKLQYIMDLRKDPRLSALMAAHFALENLEHLKNTVGGAIGKPELRVAHFFGAGEAAKFIIRFRGDPNQNAAQLFPKQAASNPGVFQDRSVGDVYGYFARKMSGKVLRLSEPKKTSRLLEQPAPKPAA